MTTGVPLTFIAKFSALLLVPIVAAVAVVRYSARAPPAVRRAESRRDAVGRIRPLVAEKAGSLTLRPPR